MVIFTFLPAALIGILSIWLLNISDSTKEMFVLLLGDKALLGGVLMFLLFQSLICQGINSLRKDRSI